MVHVLTNTKWQQVSEAWAKGENGRNVIGLSQLSLHLLLGEPALAFNRTEGLEEMWFTKDSKGYISAILKNDKVVQIETVIEQPGGELLPGAKHLSLSDVRKDHHNLVVSAYGYDLYDFIAPQNQSKEEYNAAETIWDAKVHYQGNAVTFYYDDMQKGIAFAFSVQDQFDSKIAIEKVIVHEANIAVIPASYGKPDKGNGEVPDASHPPTF